MRCIMCVPSKLTNFYLDEIASVTMQIIVSSAYATLVFWTELTNNLRETNNKPAVVER
jgi:hypothetical protein